MSVFINQSITNGISTYLRDKNENRVFAPFCFEKKIIESLIAIYDEASIVNPYSANTPEVFLNNLRAYGLSDTDVLGFISDFESLNNFIITNNDLPVKPKTPMLVSLEKRLMGMFLTKSKQVKMSDEDIRKFEATLFTNKCSNPTQVLLGYSISDDIKELSMYWEFKKYQIENPVSLKKQETIKYLAQEDYLAFNITTEMLQNMNKEQVDDLNNKIINYKNQLNKYAPQTLQYGPNQSIRAGFVNKVIIILVIIICILVAGIIVVKLWKGV